MVTRYWGLVVLFLLAESQPVGALTCGQTDFRTGMIAGRNGVATGQQCLTGANAGGYRADSCTVRLGSVTGTAHIKCAVYSGAAAATKLCEREAAVVRSLSTQTLGLGGCPTLAPNTTYWVAFNTDNATLQYSTNESTACTATDGTSRSGTAVFTDPMPNSLPAMGPCNFTMALSLTALTTTTTSTSTSSTSSSSTSVTTTTSTSSSLTVTTTSSTTTST
jgi:hypothetical protein